MGLKIFLMIIIVLVVGVVGYFTYQHLRQADDDVSLNGGEQNNNDEQLSAETKRLIEEYIETIWAWDNVCINEPIPIFNNIENANRSWIGAVALWQVSYELEDNVSITLPMINEQVNNIFGMDNFFTNEDAELRENAYWHGYFYCHNDHGCYHPGHGGGTIPPFRMTDRIERQNNHYIVYLFTNTQDMKFLTFHPGAEMLESTNTVCQAKLGNRVANFSGGYSDLHPYSNCAGAFRYVNNNWYYLGEGEDLRNYIQENPNAFPRLRLTLIRNTEGNLNITSSARA